MRWWRSCGGCVGRHAQLGGIIQRLVYGQLHVDDVFLGHKADLIADGVEIAVNIDIVDQHPAVRGRAKAGDGVHQGGFTAAALPDHHDELAGLEEQRDVFQQVQVFAHPLVQTQGFHTHAAGFLHLGSWS